MTDQNQQALVFRDREGALYALPWETPAQHRVPEEHWTELEKSMGTADVTGFGIEISSGNGRSGPARSPAGLQLLGQLYLDFASFSGAGIEVDNGGQSNIVGTRPVTGKR